MAVYGTMIAETFSFDALESFIESSTNELNSLFKSVLNEDNRYTLGANLKDYKVDGLNGEEKVKKSVIQKIKELISKFIQAVKDLFAKVSVEIQKKYKETNLIDDFVSKNKSIFTYDNFKAAYYNDVKKHGEPTLLNLTMVGKPAEITDSDFYTKLIGQDGLIIKLNNLIENIIKQNELDKANDKYKEFEDLLLELKTHDENKNNFGKGSGENDYSDMDPFKPLAGSDREFESMRDDRINKFFKNGVYLITINGINKALPDIDGFSRYFLSTKQFAEQGESYIKNIRAAGNASIKGLKIDKLAAKDSMKANAKNEDESGKITTLYYKAKFKFSTVFIKKSKQILNAVVSLLKRQHWVAINFYINVSKYIKKNLKNA